MSVKPKHFVRGKTIREWSEVLDIPLVTAYWRYHRGELEAVIDGKHVSRKFKRINGLTYQEIADKLGVKVSTAYKLAYDGKLERRLRGETYKAPTKPLCNGLDYHAISEKLGNGKPLSRQRVFQLKKRGLLEARLAGVDVEQRRVERKRKATAERREWIRNQRQAGESHKQLASRLNLPYGTVRLAFPGRTPYVAERRSMKAGISVDKLDTDESISSQRLPGESVEQFARRIGLDAKIVRRACGGKVPFAAERRVLEAQRIVAAASNASATISAIPSVVQQQT